MLTDRQGPLGFGIIRSQLLEIRKFIYPLFLLWPEASSQPSLSGLTRLDRRFSIGRLVMQA